MPNIMLYGFGRIVNDVALKISTALQSINMHRDTVITFIPSEVLDFEKRQAPFIRIYSTGGLRELNRIAKALAHAKVGFDCELCPLPKNGFLTAEQMGAPPKEI